MAEQLRVMISSTALDLPEHRREIRDACLRMGMFPMMMEELSPGEYEANAEAQRLLENSDLYILVLAYRYGYVPSVNNPSGISITEAEYNRAVERKIPRLVFLMGDEHPVRPADVEMGTGGEKLAKFKHRLREEMIVGFFNSPNDLKAQVIDALARLRKPGVTTFHYVSDVPALAEAVIAHPYTLLQTHTLIGRRAEVSVLTDWVSKREEQVYYARIMNIIAIGGMGKSALTWKWFNDIAPEEMKSLAGRMWWSFYESDATFENFVIRALAYVSERSIQEVTKIPAPERETQLLAALDYQPFLLVLDGLERILIAYARMDAARLDDSEVGKEKNLRKPADPRVGSFLKKLLQVK